MNKQINFYKTLLITFFSASICGIAMYTFQKNTNGRLSNCSYLDPVTIDYLAFSIALFLILEGMYDIYQHKYSNVRSQLRRCARVCTGVSIIMVHVLQLLHK